MSWLDTAELLPSRTVHRLPSKIEVRTQCSSIRGRLDTPAPQVAPNGSRCVATLTGATKPRIALSDGMPGRWCLEGLVTMRAIIHPLRSTRLLVFLGLLACGGPDSPRIDVPHQVERAAAGSAVFSFIYWAEPPAGRGVQFAAMTGVDAPCGLFGGSTQADDFTTLNVTLAGSTPGAFDVVVEAAMDGAAREAHVELVTVSRGRSRETIRAVGGRLTYVSGPASEAAFSGATASVSGSATFERDPLASFECDGEEETSTGLIHTSCRCARASGAEFSCESSGARECCQGEIGETIHVEFELRAAAACADACRATQPELLVYCRSLSGG